MSQIIKKKHQCRFCEENLNHVMCDLGLSPFANSYRSFQSSKFTEVMYPLKVRVCSKCYLSQLEKFVNPSEIFGEYLYLSSYSSTWVEHSKRYCDMMIARFGFGPGSQVVEIASNDGYLLQHFKDRNVRVLGIEPAANVAKIAWEKRGIPSFVKFFGVDTANELVENELAADLLMGNNVLAHVPDINDFVAGLRIALKPFGVITFEFPHLQRLIEYNQFDTVYHEHFSYLSLLSVRKIFSRHHLEIFDVEEIGTHGGSIRIFACHSEISAERYPVSNRVQEMEEQEIRFGLADMKTYQNFSEKVIVSKFKLIKFLKSVRSSGQKVVCYGAAAKGVTLINYCGITDEYVEYVVDKNPYKQNRYMPGSSIPIYDPQKILETKPDYVLILPWNIKEEIMSEMASIRDWGGKFVVPIPEVAIME